MHNSDQKHKDFEKEFLIVLIIIDSKNMEQNCSAYVFTSPVVIF